MANDTDKITLTTIVKWVGILLGVGIVLYAIWYFRFLVVCIFLALIFSLMGRPLMMVFSKLRYKKFRFSSNLAAALTLIIELIVISMVFYFLVPLLISQAQQFANIDASKIRDYYAVPISKIEHFIIKYQLMPQGVSLETYVSKNLFSIINSIKLPQIASVVFAVAGKLIMGLFITAFITFFFLRDANILTKFINSITPDKYLKEVNHIITNTRSLLSRYFIGMFIEISTMIILLTIGFSIFGFQNAILIACICGIMVIVPYIGVIIGGAIGLMILLTGVLSVNPSTDIVPVILEFVGTFAVVKLIDDFLLQPTIYSKSVKAHPLEIFLIILMAGEIGGIVGMIVAIPSYTFLRIIAKEFFSKWKFIKTLTKEIE